MQTITVRATDNRPYIKLDHPSELTRVRKAWTVWAYGLRIPGLFVVDTRTGMTLVRDTEMVTCWHAGIGPGDLARRYYPDES